MTTEKGPNIAEKVRFWEEQDKINQAVIPRVLEMHKAVLDLHKRTGDVSMQIAAAEARVLQRVREQLDSAADSVRLNPNENVPSGQTLRSVRVVAYVALALSAVTFALSLYQWFA